MITALDTNVLFDILLSSPRFCDASEQALENAAAAGGLVICDVVYAELCVHFTRQKEAERFLEENEIRVESLERSAGFLASQVWRRYRQGGGKRDRILTDFLIGAHAQTQAAQLISRDRGFYRPYFHALKVIDPSME